jgi:uridine kinase
MVRFLMFLGVFFATGLIAGERIVIGIAGGTGSGKTTLAKKIEQAFPGRAVLISQDSYYKDISNLTLAQRAKVNFDHPDSLDFSLFYLHIKQLKNGYSIDMPVYNFHMHGRESICESIDSNQIIVVEGILLFAVPEMLDLFDIKIFIDADDDVRLLRRIERDINERSRTFANVRDQYLATVKPMHDEFVQPSKKHADLIVPRGGENPKALGLIISKLKEELVK